MSIHHSITIWIEELKAGDSVAAQKLWDAYFERMVQLARQKIGGRRHAAADEEDVALSAFHSFCVGAREGRFNRLVDRDNLWPLLVAITANKSVDFLRNENRIKRGGSRNAAASTPRQTAPGQVPLEEIISREPTPQFAAELAERLECLLERLDATGDAALRQIALQKMEGYSNAEIARSLGCVRRTVERKLQVITRLWDKESAL